jgi:hypothetical protein
MDGTVSLFSAGLRSLEGIKDLDEGLDVDYGRLMFVVSRV